MNVLKAAESHYARDFLDLRLRWRSQLELGKFYAEGEQVVHRLLQSDLIIDSLLITHEYYEKWSDVLRDRAGLILLANKKWMEENTGQRLNQPCLALARVPDPPVPGDLFGSAATVVVLDGIDHAVNVGAILRNCAAFGVTMVVFNPSDTTHPFSLRAVRASLGGVFRVPIFASNNPAEFVRGLRDTHRFDVIAADPAAPVRLSQADLGLRCCIIFGNEHGGLTNPIRDLSPRAISIPICEAVDSLNVATASGIFLNTLLEARSSALRR